MTDIATQFGLPPGSFIVVVFWAFILSAVFMYLFFGFNGFDEK
jgi:hypothetical protein